MNINVSYSLHIVHFYIPIGIAICRAGFPNKVTYTEFKARYNILAAAAVAKAKKDKDQAKAGYEAKKNIK